VSDRTSMSGGYPGPREWLTADEACSYLGLGSRKALYQAVRRGDVPVHRLGKRRMRFHRRELDQVLQGR
jgi:excisionase family DNA binding protein